MGALGIYVQSVESRSGELRKRNVRSEEERSNEHRGRRNIRSGLSPRSYTSIQLLFCACFAHLSQPLPLLQYVNPALYLLDFTPTFSQ